jgi:predicted phage tail protein
MARLHEIQLGRGLRHFGQDFFGRHAAAQVDTTTQAVFLNLGIHQSPEHRGDLVQAWEQAAGQAIHRAQAPHSPACGRCRQA